MINQNKKIAFTIVELLTVLTIITILIALLIPTLATVRRMAKETQQRAQFTTIELGLTAFKNDSGDYPPSNGTPTDQYTGAQTLAEALVGYDLLGFHPNSVWNETGTAYGTTQANLNDRLEPYLELATTNAFRLRHDISNDKPGLFDFNISPLEDDTFVLCDVFTIRRITLPSGDILKAGTPILYYRANTASKLFDPNTNTTPPEDQIYNAKDNLELILQKSLTVDGSDTGKDHPLGDDNIDGKDLYKFDREGGIRDSKITSTPWPHRPDSYILISAGADGLYGTNDDIRNF